MKRLKLIKVRKDFSLGEERANSITHGIGMALGIVALVLLSIKGAKSNNALYLFSMIIYSFTLIILYANSMIYHGFPNGRVKDIFERLDHSSVYLLIAGTYTPFCLLAIGGFWGYIMCVSQWLLAIIGVVFKTIWIDKFVKLHVVIYLTMGWMIIIFSQAILDSMDITGFALLFAGGLSYSIGTIFYTFNLFKYHHLVWHLFVLAASICHFIAIYIYIYS